MTPRQLVHDRMLSVTVDHTYSAEDIQNRNIEQGAGVYIFYTAGRHEVLYVGVSKRLSSRLYSHLKGDGNADLYFYCQSHAAIEVDIILEEDEGYRELIESYLILLHNPRYNISKIARQKV